MAVGKLMPMVVTIVTEAGTVVCSFSWFVTFVLAISYF